MSETEAEILRALEELNTAVAQMKTANPKPNLLPIFQRLDELTRVLPPSTDPSLLHYLHKKSYEKALVFLQGEDARNARGSCRHSRFFASPAPSRERIWWKSPATAESFRQSSFWTPSCDQEPGLLRPANSPNERSSTAESI